MSANNVPGRRRSGTIGMANKYPEENKRDRARREAEKMIRTGNAILAALEEIEAEYAREEAGR
ncbi:hypothetical protein [Haloechinothrix salitolerans]|uniref:Uncharacterized protein n=1 Tax=Haloechinothrix salitolerans TaxID=926830 RepID=A0ABW2C9E1_9PSEU